MLFWTRKEQVQCAVSAASVVAFVYFLVVVWLDFAWSAILVRHVVPVLIMNYWLVMVTYLQHHEADTNVGFCSGEQERHKLVRVADAGAGAEGGNIPLPVEIGLVGLSLTIELDSRFSLV